MATVYSNAKRIFPIIMVSNIQLLVEICTFGDCNGSIRASNSTYMLYYTSQGDITTPLINAAKNDVSTLGGEFKDGGLVLKLYSGDTILNMDNRGCSSQYNYWECPLLIKLIFTDIKQKEINNELTNKITELSDKIDALVKKVSERSWWTWW